LPPVLVASMAPLRVVEALEAAMGALRLAVVPVPRVAELMAPLRVVEALEAAMGALRLAVVLVPWWRS
jgi:hypothetical protein